MKTHSFEWTPNALHPRSRRERHGRMPDAPHRALLSALGAGLPAALIVVLSVWAFGSAAQHLAAAGLWTGGLVFLALAIERQDRASPALAALAIALMVFAGLSISVSPEFGVLAGLLLAGQTAWCVFSRLAHSPVARR